jgi:branched-subunit amino acid transport protein AzlD
MTRKQIVWCYVLGLAGSIIAVLVCFALFDFARVQNVGLPLLIASVVTFQLLELVLERMGE